MTDPLQLLPATIWEIVDSARRLDDALPPVVAVGLAGSWARGAGRLGISDIDLVVLASDRSAMLDSTDWFAHFDPRAELIRTADFGAIAERRLRMPTGQVVEVGVGDPSWAAVDPIDPGTRRVVSDGFLALLDPLGLLARLMLAIDG